MGTTSVTHIFWCDWVVEICNVNFICVCITQQCIPICETVLLSRVYKSHYTFNLRNLSKVFQGVLMVQSGRVKVSMLTGQSSGFAYGHLEEPYLSNLLEELSMGCSCWVDGGSAWTITVEVYRCMLSAETSYQLHQHVSLLYLKYQATICFIQPSAVLSLSLSLSVLLLYWFGVLSGCRPPSLPPSRNRIYQVVVVNGS